MAFRETTLASGIPARICRISFSGELAFEINVSGWYGRAVWEEVHAAGQDLGITPYGTETMHVLRAEKGYPIVGQDTDGTVTPQDAGMDWVVSKLKDFVGKRSFSPRRHRPHRPQAPGRRAAGRPRHPAPRGHPARRAGHRSVERRRPGRCRCSATSPPATTAQALGPPFALALVAGGRDRFGEMLLAPVGDRLVEVEVTYTVLYDPEGTKRDG